MSLHENAEIVSILGLPAHVKGSSKIHEEFHARARHKFPSQYPAVKLHYLRLTFIRISEAYLNLKAIKLKCSLKVLKSIQHIHYIYDNMHS